MSKDHDAAKNEKKDAKGQFARAKKGATNDGVLSADPRVLSGKPDGDATFPTTKEKKDKRT